MAYISRPGKEGNATTYQGKVAAGYTNILAQEVDADIDAIFSAWNAGVDTVNIKNGAVGSAQLGAGVVGSRELADGGIQTVDIGDQQVTTPKIGDGQITGAKLAANLGLTDGQITSVAWTKLIAPYVGSLPVTPRAAITAGGTLVDWHGNAGSDPGYDNTKPSYLVRIDYGNDVFQVLQAPAGSTTYAAILTVSGATGRLTCNLADLSVARNQLAVKAPIGGTASASTPAGFSSGFTSGAWITYQTLNAITTRGGFVWLCANPTLIGTAPSGGGYIAQRWTRNGTQVIAASQVVGGDTTNPSPVPGVQWIDAPAAGSYTYAYQLKVDAGCTVYSTVYGDGGFAAIEVG